MGTTYSKYTYDTNKLIGVIDSLLQWVMRQIFVFMEFILPSRLSRKVAGLRQHESALHNLMGLTFFNALGGLLLMATQVKIANTMGAAIYGIYAYCVAIGEVGSMFVRYGRHKSMVRDLVQYPEKSRWLIPNTLILGLVNLLAFILVVCVAHRPLDLHISIGIVLLIAGTCLPSLDFQPSYEAMHAMSRHAIYLFLQKLIYLVAIWTFVFSTSGLSIPIAGAILFLSWAVILALEYREISSIFKFRLRWQWSDLKKLYRENFILALSNLTGVAFGPVIRIVLNHYSDSTSVGIFSAGLQIYLMSQFILTQIGRIGNPRMASVCRDDCPVERRNKFVYRYLLVMITCISPFAAALMLFPGFITDALFEAEYASLAKMLPILAVYLITLSIGLVFEQFIISMRKDKLYFTAYILGAALTVVTAFLLIPRWGFIGAAWTLCLPRAISFGLYWLFSIKDLKRSNPIT